VRRFPNPNEDSFVRFRSLVESNEFIDDLAVRVAWDRDALKVRLAVALGEAAQTLRLLGGLDVSDDARLIEIGAGLGLTSAYLSLSGFDTVALEPAAIGFDEHVSIARNVAELVGSDHEVFEFGGEDLHPKLHGHFSVIFSNNVLEHIGDLDSALRAMKSVLSPDGVMVHSCANYSVPFEPHFGIPLVPGFPRITKFLLPAATSNSDVWKSLNFINARRVKRFASDTAVRASFRPGALATSIERLGTDPQFGERHPLLRTVGRVAVASRATSLIRRLPATWATPMDFILSGQAADKARIQAWLDFRP
jgi:2-polyprenyl-3-methyl-5-hydroxy-6-metoxy-1,4-benzoquinol methylase